jgi:putative transposase
MKTVPTVALADVTDTSSPEGLTLALAQIAGAARKGLLAMSVAAGMAVMQAMLEARWRTWPGPRASTTRTGPRTDTAPAPAR